MATPMVFANAMPLKLETTAMVARPLKDLVFDLRPVGFIPTPPPAATAPLLDPASQASRLTNGNQVFPPAAVDPDLTAAEGHYRPMHDWLDDPSRASVLCRKSGLDVRLGRGPVSAKLLPFAPSTSVTAVFTHSSGGQVVSRPIPQVVMTDPDGLRLLLPFADSPDGRGLYAEVVQALMAPSANATVTLSYVHAYAAMVTPPSHPFWIDVVARREMAPVKEAAFANEKVFNPRLGPVEHPEPRPVPPLPPRPPPPPPQPQRTNITVAQSLAFGISRARDATPNPYPDLPADGQSDWCQFTPPASSPTASSIVVHFKGTNQPDEYIYVPTSYKLGFFTADDGSTLPPMRVETYVDGSGNYRVRATLVAVPHIDAALREKLRQNIVENVLDNMLPYVQLTPAGGLSAAFLSGTFSSPVAAWPQDLQIHPVDVDAPNSRLTFQFDMDAYLYSVFCQMLTRGIEGRLQLTEPAQPNAVPFRTSVDVLLRLDDMAATIMNVQAAADDATHLVVTNPLPYPVNVTSLLAFLIQEEGSILFRSEQHELVPSGLLFAKSADANSSFDAHVHPSDASQRWDSVAVVLGDTQVQGGSSEDWLNRVDSDPSLSPPNFRIHVDIATSDRVRSAVQAVRVRLYKQGDAAIRAEQLIVPGDAGWDLTVTMTLKELRGGPVDGPSFALEYFSVYQDGSLGLPQRINVSKDQKNVVLLVLVETAASLYAVDDSNGERTENLGHADALAKTTGIRQAGRTWTLAAHDPAPTTTGTGDGTTTTGTGGTGTTGTTGTSGTGSGTGTTAGGPVTPITLITSLLADAFAKGTLKQVLVVLQAATPPDAPTFSFVFSPTQQAQTTWNSPGVPPFKYRVTYVFDGGTTRELDGTESNALLILDPQAAGS